MITIETLVHHIQDHRVYSHPMWDHWADARLTAPVMAAMFHQIQNFCASTRPGLGFPKGLDTLGLKQQRKLIEEIVESESGHGADLARMAGHLVNQCNADLLMENLDDQSLVERVLKLFSDSILGTLPGYDYVTGLLPQTVAAIAVFERRRNTDKDLTWKNLGTALALEIISNQSLIPGEKKALVDSGNYHVSLDQTEMHYLAEHWGEAGAEQQHEKNVVEAVATALTEDNAHLIAQGVDDFLNSLANLWDVLDASLLQSGIRHTGASLFPYVRSSAIAIADQATKEQTPIHA